MKGLLWVDYGGSTWTLVRSNSKAACGSCGKTIPVRASRYRTKTWGPDRDLVEEYHQTCLIAQADIGGMQ